MVISLDFFLGPVSGNDVVFSSFDVVSLKEFAVLVIGLVAESIPVVDALVVPAAVVFGLVAVTGFFVVIASFVAGFVVVAGFVAVVFVVVVDGSAGFAVVGFVVAGFLVMVSVVAGFLVGFMVAGFAVVAKVFVSKDGQNRKLFYPQQLTVLFHKLHFCRQAHLSRVYSLKRMISCTWLI